MIPKRVNDVRAPIGDRLLALVMTRLEETAQPVPCCPQCLRRKRSRTQRRSAGRPGSRQTRVSPRAGADIVARLLLEPLATDNPTPRAEPTWDRSPVPPMAASEAEEREFRRLDASGAASGAVNLGAMLHQQGDTAGALAAYERAERRGDHDAAFNLGVLLYEAGDLDGAEAARRGTRACQSRRKLEFSTSPPATSWRPRESPAKRVTTDERRAGTSPRQRSTMSRRRRDRDALPSRPAI